MHEFNAERARDMNSSLPRLRQHELCIGVCVLISYEGLRKYKDICLQIEWAAVCLDEGQKIRNHEADVTVACKLLPCYHRLLLTGTPIQNNLAELWSLLDFICPGRLGSLTGMLWHGIVWYGMLCVRKYLYNSSIRSISIAC